jgi:hypothetical protein
VRRILLVMSVTAMVAAMVALSGVPAGAAPREVPQGWVVAVGEFENGVRAHERAEELVGDFLESGEPNPPGEMDPCAQPDPPAGCTPPITPPPHPDPTE